MTGTGVGDSRPRRRPRGRIARATSIIALALAAAGVVATSSPAQQPAAAGPFCPGATSTSGVPQRPGAPLRFGISPGVQTGQLGTGPVPPRTPEDAGAQRSALAALVPAGHPFVLRLTRFFWSEGEAGVQRYLALVRQYTSEGYLVELQLRYHPNQAQQGDIAAWTAFVREIVDRFGPNPSVVGLQVTNEVNLSESSDSSDGGYQGGRDALIQGVIAAKDEARRRGYDQLTVGFNWADRSDPSSDASFWSYLRANGGPAFQRALDWVGLDAYPGSFFPPTEAPGREGDGLVNGLSALRCYAEYAEIPDSVPVHIEENGYPTGATPDRSYARQAQALETMITTADAFRGTYNISDYRWFDLRDSDSSSPNFQQQYGLMTDAYAPKPAFAVYRRLIGQLSKRAAAPPTQGPQGRSGHLRVSLACVRGRLRISLRGPQAGAIRAGLLTLNGRPLAHGSRGPLNLSVRPPSGRLHVRARVVLVGGRRALLRANRAACRRRAPIPRFTG